MEPWKNHRTIEEPWNHGRTTEELNCGRIIESWNNHGTMITKETWKNNRNMEIWNHRRTIETLNYGRTMES